MDGSTYSSIPVIGTTTSTSMLYATLPHSLQKLISTPFVLPTESIGDAVEKKTTFENSVMVWSPYIGLGMLFYFYAFPIICNYLKINTFLIIPEIMIFIVCALLLFVLIIWCFIDARVKRIEKINQEARNALVTRIILKMHIGYGPKRYGMTQELFNLYTKISKKLDSISPFIASAIRNIIPYYTTKNACVILDGIAEDIDMFSTIGGLNQLSNDVNISLRSTLYKIVPSIALHHEIYTISSSLTVVIDLYKALPTRDIEKTSRYLSQMIELIDSENYIDAYNISDDFFGISCEISKALGLSPSVSQITTSLFGLFTSY